MSNDNETLGSQIIISQEEELEKLEAEVKQMGDKILQYRSSLPDQLNNTLASTIASLRPLVSTPLTLTHPAPSAQVATSEPLQVVENQEMNEKVQLLKRKMSSNAASMPIVLKRMKDCISRINKLDSQNGTIHPGFKRKR